jgi:hypothetical protein
MTTSEIKSKLIDKIKTTEDQDLLQEIYRLIETETEDLEPLILSSEQKKKIVQGEKDIKEGKYLSDKQANDEIDEWLKE